MIKINEDFNTYSEGIDKKFPGYKVDSHYKVVNTNDIEIDLNELKSFLLSKDLDSYDLNKEKFFGK
jgi:hypothetical protein